MLHQLTFDTTIPDSERHNVGAYVRSSDGTLITATGTALDVSIAGGVNVEVDLSHLDDSVRLGDGTSFFTSTSENSDIALDVHISNSNIEVTQGTSPWVVSAIDLDIRDLTAASDSVASWTHDGTGNAITSTSSALDVYITGSDPLTVNDAALANTALANGAAAITSIVSDIIGTQLANRKYLFLANEGNRKAWIGASGTVTAANGFPMAPNSVMTLRAGAAIEVAAITSAGTADMRYLEVS